METTSSQATQSKASKRFRRWGALLALPVIAVSAWQWQAMHRSEQTRRRMAVTERIVSLEQRHQAAAQAGRNIDYILSAGPYAEWRNPIISGLYEEIALPWLAEAGRKLRALESALSVETPDWHEVDHALSRIEQIIDQSKSWEMVLLARCVDPLWEDMLTVQVDVAIRLPFVRVRSARQAKVRGLLGAQDTAGARESLAQLAWFAQPARVAKWQRLMQDAMFLAQQLEEQRFRPPNARHASPGAWLQDKALTIIEGWMQSDDATEEHAYEARFAQALEKATEFLDLVSKAEAANKRMRADRERSHGLVPDVIWRESQEAIDAFRRRWWASELAAAESQWLVFLQADAVCARWLEEVPTTTALLMRWQAIPALDRDQAAPQALARWEAAMASASIDLDSYRAARAALAAAATAAEEVAASAPSRLRRVGLSPMADATTDVVSGWPTRVVHTATGMEFTLIPSGVFKMGSNESEIGRKHDEQSHSRVIRAAFYMGCTEVTQSQWRKVMARNPSRFRGDELPVEQVSWNDCQVFLKRLGAGMRLPSEAEWEYACRAGSETPFSFGPNIATEQVNYDGNFPYAGGAGGSFRERTVRVGSLPANAWGLHEMHGNVWEWCEDRYAPYPELGNEAPQDVGDISRVLRGGAFLYSAQDCRSATRDAVKPDLISSRIGFRVVFSPASIQ